MKITTNEQLGAQLRDQRKSLGLTQTQLAKRINWTQKDISLLESGSMRPDIERLLPVLVELNLELTLAEKASKRTFSTSW